MDLISVIVPIYKVEAYLDKCVQSIVNQTYADLEIILVDDGSPDRCGEMCDEWAKKDVRIKVIHKENGGLSDARNAGMTIATGEYIGFVDSDDWIEPQMYALLMDAMTAHNAQIAECDRDNFSDDDPPRAFNGDASTAVYTAEEALAQLIMDGTFRQTVWNKLYRREVLCDYVFPVGKLNEDEFWTYRVFGEATSVVYVDAPLYHYYQRSDSIIHVFNVKRLHGLEAHEQRVAYCKERFPSLVPAATARWMSMCLFHYQNLDRYKDVDPNKEYRHSVHKQFCMIDRKAAKSVISLKYRVWYAMFRIMPNVTAKLRNVLKIGV